MMRPADAFFLSLCTLSLFLLVGKLLRVKVRFFQWLFLPSSIIAGFVGLFCAQLFPHVLGGAPRATWIAIVDYWRVIPGVLISVVFATLFLGVRIPRPKELWNIGGPQLCYGTVFGVGQYLVALLLTTFVLGPLFGTPAIFACILEIGFSGGHGTAAGMAPVFSSLGFAAGSDLGQMSATVGIITAVVVGVALINIAIRRGYCTLLNERSGIPSYKKIGLIPEPQRYSIATATVATEAIEPLTFHFAVMAVAVLIGWVMLLGVKALHPRLEGFPLFPLAMIGGLLVQGVSSRLHIDKYFDRATFDRILGFALDVLVIAAIATIRLDLFLEYLTPFLLLMAVGIAWAVAMTLFVAPRMFPRYWFERGITEFGMQTGVTAVGLLLLRLVDPVYKTDTATAFGFKQMVYEPLLGGGLITATAPFIIAALGPMATIGGSAAIIVVFVLISYLSGWTRLRPTRVASEPDGAPAAQG